MAGLGKFRRGFDLQGKCCSGDTESVFLTKDWTCCQNLDDVDECGVCKGSGHTCLKKCYSPNMNFVGPGTLGEKKEFGQYVKENYLPDGAPLWPTDDHADADAFGARRRLLAEAQAEYTLQPTSATVSSGQLLSYVAVSGPTSGVTTSAGDPVPRVAGTANNGVCENNEPDTSNDCPVEQDCPPPTADGGMMIGNINSECAGNGICNRLTGECICAQGYTGDACDRCDSEEGYADVPSASPAEYACTRLLSDFQENAGDAPAPAEERIAGGDGGGLGAPAVAGIAIGAIAGVAVIGGGAYYLKRKRGAQPIASSNQQV